ncbi:MAG: hypothetical protein KIT54_09600 [Phycisphaeraceae bacterium]|nr:hypothetical protein [Phycisphaeraceae bacterium]
MASPRVLVTGFEPFGGGDDNPSWRVAMALADNPPPGVELASAILPVTWAGAWPALREALDVSSPDVVLLLGQSGKRPMVTVERFALNFGQGRIADNDGVAREPGPLVEGGPLALAATLDVDACVAAMAGVGVPASASHDAGAFLCNAVLYHALHGAPPGRRAGFVHLPMLPGQKGASDAEPTLEAAESERAVRAIVAALA